MKEFFRGWRRKGGVLTLLMACVLTGGWMRSLSTRDLFNFPIDHTRLLMLVSNGRNVEWDLYENQAGIPACDFHYSLEPRDDSFHVEGVEARWQWSVLGFQAGVYDYRGNGRGGSLTGITSHMCKLPYWSIILPLNLISAWLLLSKTLPPAQKKINEPIPAGEA